MARRYHSASSLELGKRCQRAWAYYYIDRIRDSDVSWSEIASGAEHTPRQRSRALGTEVDSRLESWYAGGHPVWSDVPGVIASTGAYLLPTPDECTAVSQQGLGDIEVSTPHGPMFAVEIDGVKIAGAIDVETTITSEDAAARLDVPLGEPIVNDYKTSKNIAEYALDGDTLPKNLQANSYAYGTCVRYDRPYAWLRWVYMSTVTDKPEAVAVETVITLDEARAYLTPWIELARQLDRLTSSDMAPANNRACGEYAGCPYHHSSGGPCTVRRSIGALLQIQARRRAPKRGKKAMNTGDKAALKAKVQAAKAARDAARAEREAAVEETPKPARKKRVKRVKKASEALDVDRRETVVVDVDSRTVEVHEPEPVQPVQASDDIVALAQAVRDAEAAWEQAGIELSDAKARLREACQ